MKKNMLNNQNGMSLISVIGASAVIGAGILGALQLAKMSESGKQSIKSKSEAISLTSMVETRVKSMFMDTKESDGKLKTGICSLLGVTTQDSQLTNVFVQFPKDGTLLSEKIWNKAFGEFEQVRSGCKLSNSYGRCYKLKSDTLDKLGITDATFKALDPVFEIDIRAMYTNPATADTFREIKIDPTSKYDVKSIGFQYSVRSSYQKNGKPSSEFLAGFIWTGDAGVCDISDKKVSLTANSFGDPSNQTMFNLAGFSADSKSTVTDPPLNVTMLNTQIRSGILGGALGSQFLTSRDTASDDNPNSGPAYSACNEMRFQCPQLGANNRSYQSMRHLLRVGYQVPNVLQNTGSSVEFSPSVVFKDTASRELKANYSQNFTLGDYRYYQDKDGRFKTKINGTEVPLRVGSEDMLLAQVTDAGGINQADNVCRNICVPQTNFNSNTNNHYTSHFTYKVHIGRSPSQEFSVASGPVACTACYMKNCDQFGLGTFGPMHEQPTEPLDASIPECFQYENHVNEFYESKVTDLGFDSANKCISAKLKSGDNEGLSYFADSCEQEKPVMCFGFGKHLLARMADLSGSKIIKKKFEMASDACFSLGTEIIKKNPLRTLFVEQGNADATAAKFLGLNVSAMTAEIDDSQRMTFINLSTQGSYFAPVGLNQEARLREFAHKTGETTNLLSTNFWVNLKTDSAGYIYAPAPRLSSLAKSSDNKWGLHYDGSGRLVVEESPLVNVRQPNASDADQRQVGLLFHSHRLKGVEFGRSTSPLDFNLDKEEGKEKAIKVSDGLRVLCRKNFHPYSIFVSSKKTDSFNHAHQICKDEGGVFLPPTTTAGWEKALLLVNNNSAVHPFPHGAETLRNPVWVNLVKNGSDEVIDLPNFLGGTFSKIVSADGSSFSVGEAAQGVKEKLEKVTDLKEQMELDAPIKPIAESFDVLCFDKGKGEMTIRSQCQKGEKMLSEQEALAAMDGSNKVLRSLLYIAFANKPSYKNNKVKLHQ